MFNYFRSSSVTSASGAPSQGLVSPTSKLEPDPKKPLTFRLSLIPSSIDEEKLRRCLDSLSYTKQSCKKLLALSLVERGGWQVATVTFLEVPSEFQKCSRNNAIDVELDIEGIKSEITIDVDFYGVSPLYSSPQEQATVE
jgi:hypothetical protein